MRLCAPGRKPKTIQHKYFAPDPYLSPTVEGVDCSDGTKQIVSQDQHYDMRDVRHMPIATVETPVMEDAAQCEKVVSNRKGGNRILYLLMLSTLVSKVTIYY